MSFAESISPLVGRLGIGLFFLLHAWAKLENFSSVAGQMAAKGIGAAPLALTAAIVTEVLGGLGLIAGYRTRLCALLLFGFTLTVSVVMHDFWTLKDAAERGVEMQYFLKNLAIASALIFVFGSGPGRFALDGAGGRR